MYSTLEHFIVFSGALILFGSIFTTRRLIAQLPDGPERRHWHVMQILILIFIAGYLGYIVAFWNREASLVDLIVPGVFFLGACFVWLTSSLSLRTAVVFIRLRTLEQENISDPLTGAFNRRYLDRRLKEEINRARRHGTPLSVLMLDIDHFKQVNDTHGHQAGDKVQVDLAGLVKEELRETDMLARYGGEEFLVLALQTPDSGAVNLAERIRARLESSLIKLTATKGEEREIRVTCSIGVASFGGAIESVEKLVGIADQNLYSAKQAGRNRVGTTAQPAGSEAPLPVT